MDENTLSAIYALIFMGWVPILAIGKAVAMIIEARKRNK